MATNETTKPEDEKTTPATETQTTEQAAPVNEQLNIDNATPPTDTPAQEAAATPQAEERNSNKDDKIVPPNSTEKPQAAQDKKPAEEKAPEQNPPEQKQPRPGRPPKADKADKPAPKSKPAKAADEKKSGGGKRTAKTTGEEKPKTPKATEKAEPKQPDPPAPPPEPTEAPRTGEQEQIVYLNLSELHPFKNHPFQVRQDAEMTAMVESVKDKGVTQPAIVRPRESGGYELVSGHRRQ
ncbi:MAG: ParB N-terminal domain-containing protein, partial [Defluviitaleaceae bacterium]|nr:ParB N-terminal domain-containing protein [Defluviitaleaceae bacterium]